MKLVGIVLTLILTASCLAQKKPFVGTYEALRIANGKVVDNKLLPTGQVMYLELHAEGNWTMRNMLVGFDGKWHISGKQIVLITEFGPAGKISPPEKWLLTPKPDRSRLVPTSPKKIVGQIEFHYAPNVKADIAKRMKAVTK